MITINNKESIRVSIIGDVHISDKTPRCRQDNYLEAILNKLEYVLERSDIVICLGDLFDSPTIEESALNKFLTMLLKHKESGKRFFTIWGNHDLYKYNLEQLNRTTLGLALIKDNVEHLDELKIHNILFKEIPFKKYYPDVPIVNNNTILLGHYFYECTLAEKSSIKLDQVIDSKARFVFLGHDHQPYPNMLLGDTVLVRQGSLCRNTANIYNYDRPILFTQFTITKDACINELKEVDHKPSLEALHPKTDVITKVELNSSIDLDTLIESFKSSNIEAVSLSEAISKVNSKSEVKECIMDVHSALGLKFK